MKTKAALAVDASSLKDTIQENQVGKGEKATKPKVTTREALGDGKPKLTKRLIQPEIPGAAVKQDRIGIAAEKAVDAIEEFDAAADNKGSVIADLIKAMKKAKRATIQVRGYTFAYTHQGPKDSISVKKPK